MTTNIALSILFIIAIIAANIPFLTNKVFLIFGSDKAKSFWLRFAEWFFMYLIVMAIAIGLETKLYGQAYKPVWEFWHFSRNWEFYFITICLFLVFALPGFLYHYDLKKYLNLN